MYSDFEVLSREFEELEDTEATLESLYGPRVREEKGFCGLTELE